MAKLARFEISATPDGFAIQIANDEGQSLDLDVTPEQLDAVIDALDELLTEEEEAAFGVDDTSDGDDDEAEEA